MHIQDSTALVTGANRGIGKAFADALLDRGARKVYAAVRDVATVTDPRLVPIQLDVTDADRIAAVARELDDVQLVVNNAGVLNVAIPLSASLDTARLELETNYLSLVSMTQAFAPVLERNGGGAFVNVLSVYSWVAMPLISTYSASKAAAWSFTNAARVDLRRQGTQVVGVHVGAVDTDMAAQFDMEKLPPTIVAASALDALEAGEPEAAVDDYSRAVKAALSEKPYRDLATSRQGAAAYAMLRRIPRRALDRGTLKRLREIQEDFLTCGLYVDAQGGLWMSGGMNGMIFKLDWNGKVLGWFGKWGPNADSNDIGEAHQLAVSRDLRTVYVADSIYAHVLKLERD